MAHSPIKTVVNTVYAESNMPPSGGFQEESIGGLMGMSKAAQVSHHAHPQMRPPQMQMNQEESIGGLIASSSQQMANPPSQQQQDTGDSEIGQLSSMVKNLLNE